MFFRSLTTAVVIAAAVQCFTVGVLSPKLSLELCRPGASEVRTMSFENVSSLNLRNTDGSVRVNTHPGRGMTITATIRAYTSDYQSQPIAEQYVTTVVSAIEAHGQVEITTEPGQRPDELELRVDYLVEVPEGTDISLAGSNGNVWVAAGCGNVEVEGNNSDIEVVAPRGTVQAKSANGRIRITQSAKEAILETVNGSIYADVSAGELRASTANGSIDASLTAANINSCDLTAMNGGITLSMAEACSARLIATTGRGSIRCDAPIETPAGNVSRRELRGQIGAGETQVSLSSLNGNIVIARSNT